MQLQIDIDTLELEAKTRPGMWDQYPFLKDGRTVWIDMVKLSDQQIRQLMKVFLELGQRKTAEAEELRRFSHAKFQR